MAVPQKEAQALGRLAVPRGHPQPQDRLTGSLQGALAAWARLGAASRGLSVLPDLLQLPQPMLCAGEGPILHFHIASGLFSKGNLPVWDLQ